jgi:hypothetical protein
MFWFKEWAYGGILFFQATVGETYYFLALYYVHCYFLISHWSLTPDMPLPRDEVTNPIIQRADADFLNMTRAN